MKHETAKNRSGPREPAESHATERRRTLSALEEGPLSAREISGRIGVSEKEVYGHLEHIRTSLHRSGGKLIIRPAECAKCGFLFVKRGRLKRPGRCPVCRSESIHPPLFSIGAPGG